MPTFAVTITTSADYTVEADNEAEACEVADQRYTLDRHGIEPCYDVTPLNTAAPTRKEG